MSTYDSLGDSDRKYTRPAEHIKALNVGPIPQRIFDDMSKYEDTARGKLCITSRRPFPSRTIREQAAYFICVIAFQDSA